MTPELHRPWFSHYEPSVPRTVTVFDQPLYSLLDEAAARYPKRPALIFQNTRLSYKALHEAAERFAGALRRAGIRPGQRVAVMLPNLPQTMIAFWGVVKCGAVAVMVNPLYMERELLQNLNDAGAECLVLLDMLWPRVAPLRDRLPVKTYVVTGIADALSFPLNLIYRFTKGRQKAVPIPYDDKVIAWKDFSRGAQPLSEPIADPQNTPALLQYTGGTTGIPKGVALTHSNLGTNCRQILSIIQETPETEHSAGGPAALFPRLRSDHGPDHPGRPGRHGAAPAPLCAPGRAAPHRQAPPHGLPRCARGLQLAAAAKTLGQYDLTCIKLCISGSITPRYFPPLPGADRRHHPRRLRPDGSLAHHAYQSPRRQQAERRLHRHALPALMPIVIQRHRPRPKLGNWSSVACRSAGPLALCLTIASALRNGWLYTGDLGPGTRKAISSSWTARRTWSSWAATTSIRVKWTKSCWNTPTCWKA